MEIEFGPTKTKNAKAAAIEQWTADPCGPEIGFEPGTQEYFEKLIEARHEYGPWMQEELGYAYTEGLDVLDVGCGQGIDVAQYAEAGANVTGIDLTPRHVELAAKHVESIGLDAEIINGDAENLPFPDNSFDRVSSNGVLHHTPNMPAALEEIQRVLRPGGEARIFVYNRHSFHYWLNQVIAYGLIKGRLFSERSMAGVLTGVERTSIGARPLVNVYSRKEVRDLLEDSGFLDVRVHSRHFNQTDAFPYGIAASRLARLRDPKLMDRIGRKAGWYVIGRGISP